MSEHVPIDPRLDRFRPLSRALRVVLVLTAVLAVLAVLLPGRVGEVLGAAMVAVLVVAPLLRVVWFVQRWWRRGDRRFAAVAMGVLVVIGTGVLLALAGL